VEPAYDAESVKAKRQRRIVRTRVAAALASGATFGAAVVGFALHDHSSTRTTGVSSTTATTTFGQPDSSANDDNSVLNDDNGFGSGATPGNRGGSFDTGTRGS